MATGFTYRHYVLKDHLGSWTTITDAEGNVEQELSFDAWGNLRDADTWTGTGTEAPMFDRGYTGHEHLDAFGLINMNGRCYDPMMSSFLSVDAYLQDPTSAPVVQPLFLLFQQSIEVYGSERVCDGYSARVLKPNTRNYLNK